MTRSPRSSLVPFTLLTLLLGSGARCAVPNAQGPGRPLPSYAGRSLELFDDTIEPAAAGIALDVGDDPRADRKLRERTQVGDAALRVRIATVTSKDDDGVTRYVVGLRTVERLAGSFPPGDNFEIRVGRNSPSSGLLKGLGDQLAGKPFVGFFRLFVRPDGDPELHFHLAPDTKLELAAVRDAAALGSL